MIADKHYDQAEGIALYWLRSLGLCSYLKWSPIDEADKIR